MTGFAVVADREEKATEPRALQAEQDERGDDEPQEQVDRHQPEHTSRA